MKPKKAVLIRIDSHLDSRLTDICRHGGYKKTGLIEKLIRDYLEKQIEVIDPIQAAKDFGIDTSLLASTLSKTPSERLQDLQAAHEFAEELRKAGERARSPGR